MSKENRYKTVTRPFNVAIGCDPEIFLQTEGEIIGAEKAIPVEGIKTTAEAIKFTAATNNVTKPAIVLDGVQAELHPGAHTCRAHLGNEIAAIFRTLRSHLETKKGIEVSFAPVVKVSKKELDGLSDAAKILGCAPSKNAYDPTATIDPNASKSAIRSAGGHLHFSCPAHSYYGFGTGPTAVTKPWLHLYPERVATLCDILVGIPSVMIDRDPMAAERRKTYGRAGEFRTPPHGFEYRTLSNFWLRGYPLLSMVAAQGRTALGVIYGSEPEIQKAVTDAMGYPLNYPAPTRDENVNWDAEKELLSLVNVKEVRKAINHNDLDLAKKCWEGISEFIRYHVVNQDGINASNIDLFDHFIWRIDKAGLDYWFSTSPMEHWCNLREGHYGGWETFLTTEVQADEDILLAKLKKADRERAYALAGKKAPLFDEEPVLQVTL